MRKLNKSEALQVTLKRVHALRDDINEQIKQIDLKESDELIEDIDALERVKTVLEREFKATEHEDYDKDVLYNEIVTMIELYKERYQESLTPEQHNLFNMYGSISDTIELLTDELKRL